MAYVEWLRNRVGSRKVILVFGSVVVQDELGRVLLQRRTEFDFWGLPGGVMEPDETIEACARRELMEETGLTTGELALVGVYTDPKYDVVYPNGDEVQQYTVCFAGRRQGGDGRPDGVETTAQRFWATEELPGLNIPLWYRDMIADALAAELPRFSPPFAGATRAGQLEAVRLPDRDGMLVAAGAAAVVVDDDGRLLVAGQEGEGHWRFPMRLCDIGENAANTAVRAAAADTGRQIRPERIVGVYSGSERLARPAAGERVREVVTFFRASLVKVDDLGNDLASSGVSWISPEELAA